MAAAGPPTPGRLFTRPALNVNGHTLRVQAGRGLRRPRPPRLQPRGRPLDLPPGPPPPARHAPLPDALAGDLRPGRTWAGGTAAAAGGLRNGRRLSRLGPRQAPFLSGTLSHSRLDRSEDREGAPLPSASTVRQYPQSSPADIPCRSRSSTPPKAAGGPTSDRCASRCSKSWDCRLSGTREARRRRRSHGRP